MYVDFSGVVALDDVAERTELAYRSVKSLGRRVTGWLRGIGIGVGASLPPVSGQIGSGTQQSTLAIVQRNLRLPEAYFRRTGQQVIVMFDEFQDLLGAGIALDGLFRSVIQHQGSAATYVFAGSHPGLMSELFSSRERPLYGQARPVTLGPLADDELRDYLVRRFAHSGREVSVVIDDLLRLVQGHPQRAMLVAHHLWEKMTRGTGATTAEWAAARSAALDEVRSNFRYGWDQFGAAEKEALLALAHGREAARYVVERLALDGQVFGSSPPRLVDPLMEVWLRDEHEVDQGGLEVPGGEGGLTAGAAGQRDARLTEEGALRILALLESDPREWPERSHLPGRSGELADATYVELAAVTRNLSTRDSDAGLSRAERELMTRSVRLLVTTIAEALGISVDEAERRVFAALESNT